MSTAEPPNLRQPVNDTTRAQAQRLLREASHAALAVLEPGSGHPLVSRVALARDADGTPIILISALSAHTAALRADARCSLLVGEPGQGDPLAHPRMTVVAQAQALARDGSPDFERIRSVYLSQQPKAQLYVDFADFGFWRLRPLRASLNGGFGRAHELTAQDLLGTDPELEKPPGHAPEPRA